MRKKERHQRRAQLGLRKVKKSLEQQDLPSRAAPEGEFRIIGVNQFNKNVWIEDTVSTFAQAKEKVDNLGQENVVYYVHNDSNRIIYDSKKE